MDIGAGELLIVLVVIVLLFGPGRLANLGGELGESIREFRKGLDSSQEEKPAEENLERPEKSEP
jgi:sec-independent protein translocase protein TatA